MGLNEADALNEARAAAWSHLRNMGGSSVVMPRHAAKAVPAPPMAGASIPDSFVGGLACVEWPTAVEWPTMDGHRGQQSEPEALSFSILSFKIFSSVVRNLSLCL
jgi:hypothetical protein